MIITASQPYFAPFPGFFFKAAQADLLVILDTVQFPRGFTWMTRNRLKNDSGTLWMSVPVWRRGLGLQRIDEVNICWDGAWPRKHLASLKTAYTHAPFIEDHLDFLEGVFNGRYERLVDLNMAVIDHLMANLGIKTRMVRLSCLTIKGSGTQLLVDICRSLGADQYLAQRPARKFLDEKILADAKIRVRYVDPAVPVYPQLWGKFIANLSALDLLFNCGPKSESILLGAGVALPPRSRMATRLTRPISPQAIR